VKAAMEKALRRNQRRRVPRISIDIPVILISGKKKFPCRAGQLSEFGIFVTSPHHELVGKNIRIDLTLEPPETALSLTGIVIHSVESGTGIRFEDVTPEQRRSLERYVRARGIGIVKP